MERQGEVQNKFQPEVWNFTVKPSRAVIKLFIDVWLQIGKAREIERRTSSEFGAVKYANHLHCLRFLSQFHQDNKIQKRNLP